MSAPAPRGFEPTPREDGDLSDFAAGWDSSVWDMANAAAIRSTAAMVDHFAERAAYFEALAYADELRAPESAAYKAGAAYAYRMAQNDLAEYLIGRGAV